MIRQVSRRGFLSNVLSAGTVVLGVQVFPGGAKAADAVWQPSVYLGLSPDGTVTIVTHRSEMGTGCRSALPTIVADELEADWSKVKIVQAVGDEKYGSQNTDGSCSVRDFFVAMREAGATARTMLERAAAAQWNVPASECKGLNHAVVHSSGRKLGYGELVTAASKLPVPAAAELKLKSDAEFKYIGKDLPTIDEADLCAGKGTFGYDAKVPGMVYASIARSPVYGGKMKSFDDTEAKKVAGVQQTVVIEPLTPPYLFKALGGVAVIADNTWSAMQARKKLKVDWDSGANASWDSAAYKKSLLETAKQPQKVVRNVGDVDAAFAKASKTIEASYYAPLLSHAPMEPPAAIADFQDGKVTLWAATQNPQAVQDAVSGALGIDKKNVICNVTLLGGGFGRKSKPDYCCEAALLSKKIGKPVKVAWSREEDIQFDYYHSVAGMYMKAATGDKGLPTAWLQRSVFPSIGSMFNAEATHGEFLEMGMGWSDVPFAIPNHRAENGPAKHPVRIGWLRAVANIYHAFAVHSFADELAAAANRDRVEYLLDLIGPGKKLDFDGMKVWNNGQPLEKFPVDTARLRNVIELAAQKSDWAKKKPAKNRALGIAAHRSFLTYVAVVADVEVTNSGQVIVHRIDLAADPGSIINPDRVRAQFEGAAVFGTSIALMGEITGAAGRVQQSNFHDYRVARMNEAPKVTNIHIVPSKEPHAGVGEPGVPPVAPAICNAIFAATGKRIRELPIRNQLRKA